MTTDHESSCRPKNVLDVLVPPHPRGRLPRRHGHGAEPRLLPLRRPQRPADPRLLLELRDAPGRLQPPEDARPGVPRSASSRPPSTKPANSDIYTEHFARFVETFSRLAVPPTHPDHLFFVEGGALGGREHAEDRLRLEGAQEPRARQGREGDDRSSTSSNAFHGRSGYSLSLTNTADPRKTQYFPKFDWPRL